ncbi:hypothetical protein LTR53_008437 [Teratosphaeriaceae sp. CCFEE 6253]|nr:hypothetical protein LTR53_008437 [Teratosphaeriaceae sp. CCFEE 6253]
MGAITTQKPKRTARPIAAPAPTIIPASTSLPLISAYHRLMTDATLPTPTLAFPDWAASIDADPALQQLLASVPFVIAPWEVDDTRAAEIALFALQSGAPIDPADLVAPWDDA